MHYFQALRKLPLLLVLPVVVSAAGSFPSLNIPSSDIVDGKFIITLKPSTNETGFLGHLDFVENLINQTVPVQQEIEKTWSTVFQGYSGQFDFDTLKQILTRTEVLAVEPVRKVKLYQTTTISQSGAPWGLGSISHRTTGSISYLYKQTSTLNNYWAYVVDTGVYTGHNDFEGRAYFGYNAVKNSANTDTLGHGTHVAGTIASKTYGVAKKANIMSVKVSGGDITTTDVIVDGIVWAATNITNTPGRTAKSVINISMGSSKSTAFNAAVTAAYNAGILVVVASGNDGFDTSFYSPGSATNAFVVGAIDQNNARPSFSNYGSSVSIYAPGVNIISLGISSPSATLVMTGTSMASPHVAGLALYLKDLENISTAANLAARIKALATKNVVSNAGWFTQTLLAYNGIV